MHTILDLDLDFFVWPIERDRADDEPRLDENAFAPASAEQVRRFLENRCGLSTAHPIPGRLLVQHVDAFSTWREWLSRDILVAPFNVVHADAHSDLGSGWPNESPRFYETELLAHPLEERISPRVGTDALNSGNYLVAAVANRWVYELKYVYPTDPLPPDPAKARIERIQKLLTRGDGNETAPSDLPTYCFKDWSAKTRIIELREYSKVGYSRVDSSTQPVHVEPEVPFDWVEADKFEFSGFTHMVVAQSPAYTPSTADPLLKIIEEYFTPA